jgi:Protein of unknown function (DUF4238)
MVARRHHYVPKCYLNLFSNEVPGKQKRELNVYDSVERKTFKTAPENVALEKDFNTIDIEGHEPDAFEKALAAVESDIGPALQRIVKAKSLMDENDKELLLTLVALLHVRNPRFRERKRDFHERVQKRILDMLFSSRELFESQMKRAQVDGFLPAGDLPDFEEVKKSYNENNFKALVPVVEHIISEVDLFEHIMPLLRERGWVVVSAPSGSQFVTGDHPVSLMWSEPKKVPIGLKLKGTEVVFPISPGLAVVGAYELKDGHEEGTAEQIASINGTTILNSGRQVYAFNGDFAYQIDQSKEAISSTQLVNDELFKSYR